MTNELEIIEKDIKNLIYEIRGKQVMLDSDLAILYECKNGTKEINQAMKRNVEKFPEEFCFQLNDEESKRIRLQFGQSTSKTSRSQTVTLNKGKNSLKLSELDLDKFNKQYPNLELKYSNKYHDRFIIIDKYLIYHLGASLKDLGLKCFGINIIKDKSLIDKIDVNN